MINIVQKDKCTACQACFNICPKNSISMIYDNEGFLYPKVTMELCVNCGLCSKVCPINKKRKTHNQGIAYLCMNKDINVRLTSSSGGIFSLLAECVISEGGRVFGAAYNEEFDINHIEISKAEDIYMLRGSKYTQSNIGDTYSRVKKYLNNGETVLFSGTPCQIAGLKSFLGKNYENLILQDIICHGVPSPGIWRKYVKYREENSGSKTMKISQRDKTSGWEQYSMNFKFKNGTEYRKTFSEDIFMRGFLSDLYCRPSCYNCYFKSIARESDITLADFWGIKKVCPEYFDNKGVSLVFVNSIKGEKIFNRIHDKLILKTIDINEAVKYNSSAYKSCTMPHSRKKIMKKMQHKKFFNYVEKYTKKSFHNKVLSKIKQQIRQLLHR